MKDDSDNSVRLPLPGRRTREFLRISKVLALILLVLLGTLGGLPIWSQGLPRETGRERPGTSADLGEGAPIAPASVGADSVPDLSLPHTVLSNVEKLIGAGGVIQTSPDNITLYNSAVSLRLLGDPFPHDELLGPGGRKLSSYSSWTVEADEGGLWIPLLPLSNKLIVLGTNTTGTFVVRSMQVEAGLSVGAFRIVYKATSAGPLKWDLDFTASTAGHYRLAFGWSNVANSVELETAMKRFKVSYPDGNYTLSWDDVSPSLNATANHLPGQFSLVLDLGNMTAGSRVLVDPSIVSTSTSSLATAYTFQRKVFYDPKGGYYFVFYYIGQGYSYRSSKDGLNWSVPQPSGGLQVFNSGDTVIVANGGLWHDYSVYYGGTISVSLKYTKGKISGPNIVWEQPVTVVVSLTCPEQPECTEMTLGIRHVNVGLGKNGLIAISYNTYVYYRPNSQDPCFQPPDSYFASSSLNVWYQSTVLLVEAPIYQPNAGCAGYNQNDEFRSVVLPDPQGEVQVVYQRPTYDFVPDGSRTLLLRRRYVGGAFSTLDTISGAVTGTPEFSATVDPDYGTHVLYKTTTTRISYYYVSSGGAVTTSSDIFSGQAFYPTLTVDNSNNDIYAFAIQGASSIVMRKKSLAFQWSDSPATFPITHRTNPLHLVSNFASISNSNSSRFSLVWTEPSGPSLYNVTFASIPVQTVWSPYSDPPSPWDGNGVSPYGQYFVNLGEYVSPSTGLLTIRQTDLSIPGRGLNFDVTRVYAEPYSFGSMGPYLYERYPWAPIGNGWQLNYPWFNNAQNPYHPAFIHLWDGQGYQVPASFWNGTSSVFDNHDGEHFHLMRNSTGTFLFVRSGASYFFDTGYRLRNVTDTTGKNTITFQYDTNNRIANVTDSVGRVFQFCYNGGLLQAIYETSGTCASPGTSRSVVFGYSGSSLVKATDPGGRNTTYLYAAVSNQNVAPWLLSRITYPTRWYSNYTYTPVLRGTETTSYRVFRQRVSASFQSVKRFDYSYSQGPSGDQVTNSTVTTYGGLGALQVVGYTRYSFSFAGMTMNVSDSNNRLVRGVQQRFGASGEVPREIVLVSDGYANVKSYTNYYRYDLWGNLIYTRSSINPSANWYHENFNTYYDTGISPGFFAFQESFGRGNYTLPDQPWSVSSGTWLTRSGQYSGVSNGGYQESVFAWSNVTKSDLSIKASIYLGNKINSSDARVGLFTHYPGNGMSKWALVVHNATTGVKLSLLEEFPAVWRAEVGCPVSIGNWYTLNFTVRGIQAAGWLTGSGGTSCNVSGSFGGGTLSSATGFGLYAGGYSALFDNVTVATVFPYPSSTGFSNSFTNTPPGPNNHDSLAGSAQLSNSTGSVQPVEGYFSYSPWGGLIQKKQRYDPAPGTVQWVTTSSTFDSYGNLNRTTDAKGSSTYYSYSTTYQSAYLTNQTRFDGTTNITTRYAYNFTTGNVKNMTDPMNTVTDYQNDNLGRATRIDYALGAYVQYNYNDQANYVDTTNENNWKTRQIYDGLARLAKKDRFLNGVSYSNESYSYNWQDKVTIRTDELGNMYQFQYDLLGRTTNETRPNNLSVITYYNDTASWVRFTDEDNNYRCNIYDRQSRLIQVIERSNDKCYAIVLNGLYYVTSYYHDEVGNLARTTRSDVNYVANPGFETGSFQNWTPTGDAVIKSNNGHSGKYSAGSDYDPMIHKYLAFTLQQNLPGSVPAKRIVALQLWYRYGFGTSDSVRVLYTDGGYTSTPLTNVASWTLKNLAFEGTRQISGIKVIRTTDQSNDLIVDDFVLRLSYSTSYAYDNLGRLTTTSYADGTVESYLYDNNGNPVRKIDRKNIKTLYSYDSLDRVKTVTFCGTPITSSSYSYDKNSNVLGLQNQNATVKYIYDARNRPLSEEYQVNLQSRNVVDLGCSGSGSTWTVTGGVSQTYMVGFSYNGELMETLTYPGISNFAVKYYYDGLGRVVNITQSGTSNYYARSFTYYKNDERKGLQFGNGIVGNYTYDSLSRPSLVSLNNGGANLLTLNYSYNKTGTIASVTGNANGSLNEQHKYDPLRRLTNATLSSQLTNTTLAYGYDDVGNRISQSQNGILTSYNYTYSNNRLTNSTSTSVPNTQITYSYDSDGNLLTRNVISSGTEAWLYSWDASNHLQTATNIAVSQSVYIYDGLGRRLESVEGYSTTFYGYLGTESLYEKTGTTDIYFVYAGGLRIAKITGSTINYYHTDHLGSTRLVTSSSGSVMFSDSYQPFGQDNGPPTGSETYRFTGKPVSATTGLYYYYHRWYDPSVGRFISWDPKPGKLTNPQTLNPYVYVINSPLNYNDPRGEFLNILIGAVAGAVIGGAVCAWQHGGWSNSCLTSIAVGAVAGAVAGATFNPALGLAAQAGLSGLGASVVAGAVSGAASGAASYVAQGGLATATGQQFNWSAKDFALSVGVGALAGGALAGAGYGVSRLVSQLRTPLSQGGIRYSSYLEKSGHVRDIAKAITGDASDLQSAENLISNTLETGEINAARSGGGFLAFEQIYGNPLSGKPVGLRVIWDILYEEARNAYPFPV